MKYSARFSNEPSSVPNARHFVTQSIHDHLSPASREVVEVMVSELVTNAVRHAHSSFTLAIDLTDGVLRVAVTDRGPGQPVVRSPEVTEPSGRGLHIVESLADAWGIDPLPDGKTVWLTYRLDQDTPARRS